MKYFYVTESNIKMKYPEGGLRLETKKINGIHYFVHEKDLYNPNIIDAYCFDCGECKKLDEFVKHDGIIRNSTICKECCEKIKDKKSDSESDFDYEKDYKMEMIAEMKYRQEEEKKHKFYNKVWNKRFNSQCKSCKCPVCDTFIQKHKDSFGIVYKKKYIENVYHQNPRLFEIVCDDCSNFHQDNKYGIQEYHDIMKSFKVIKLDSFHHSM